MLTRWREALRERWSEWFQSKVVWLTGSAELQALSRSRWALLVIWGRDLYSESHRRYPIARWSDAYKAARLEIADSPSTRFHIGPYVDGSRLVSFYQFADGTTVTPTPSLWWLPESLVLTAGLQPTEVLTLERGALRYFLSAAGSQVAGGLVRSAETYALASGIPGGWTSTALDEAATRARLLVGLTRVAPSAWSYSWSPDIKRWVGSIAKPAAAGLIALLLVYMLAVSIYLEAAYRWRERSLLALGPEVGALLDAQRRLDELEREQSGYGKLQTSFYSVTPAWGSIAETWRAGGVVRSVKWVDGKVSLRAGAPDATVVLKTLSETDLGLRDPVFSSAVREERGLQEFAIDFAVKQ
jgi:hypothetical protein